MTNKEALTASLQVEFPDSSIDKALIDADITGTDTYTLANTKVIDEMAIELLQGLLSTPDVSEGDMSIKYDRKAVQARVDYLMGKSGKVSQPKVRDVSHLW